MWPSRKTITLKLCVFQWGHKCIAAHGKKDGRKAGKRGMSFKADFYISSYIFFFKGCIQTWAQCGHVDVDQYIRTHKKCCVLMVKNSVTAQAEFSSCG